LVVWNLTLYAGVYQQMATLRNTMGMTLIFASLLMASTVLSKEYAQSCGIPVLLSHRCSQEEELHRGDRREVFVRYQLDHSSFVNGKLMPVQDDLRQEIAGVMATRNEQVLYFAADDGLTYREVSTVLSDLKKDSPELSVILLTKSQIKTAQNVNWTEFRDSCVLWPS
jgi:biopolymer transport protein ExbD